MPDYLESRGEGVTQAGPPPLPALSPGVDSTVTAPERPGGADPRFALGAEVFRDSLGVAYDAIDRLARRDVALKRISPEICRDEARLTRLVKELSAARLLHHPGIVTIHDFVKEGDEFLYTMEPLAPVGPLAHLRAQGAPSVAEIKEILAPVCEALQHFHPSHVHGAVCARHIVFSREGASKLIDFGVWKPPVEDPDLDVARRLAPELQGARQAPSPRADVWGLGLALFEMLTGELPGRSIRSIRQLRPDLPAALDEVFRKSLCPMDRRYGSVQEFAEALNACAQASLFPTDLGAVGGTPALRRTPPAALPPRREKPSRPRALRAKLAGAAAGGCAGVLLVWAALFWRHPAEESPAEASATATERATARAAEQAPATEAPAGIAVSAAGGGGAGGGGAQGLRKADFHGFWQGAPFDLLFLGSAPELSAGWYLRSGDPLVHFLGKGEVEELASGEVRVSAPMGAINDPDALAGESPAPDFAESLSVLFKGGADALAGEIRRPSTAGATNKGDRAFTLERAPYTYFYGAELKVVEMTAQVTKRADRALEVTAPAPTLGFSLAMPVAQAGQYKVGALLTMNRKTACLVSVDQRQLSVMNATAVYKDREDQWGWLGTVALESGDHAIKFWVEDLNKEEHTEPLGVILRLVVLAPAK